MKKKEHFLYFLFVKKHEKKNIFCIFYSSKNMRKKRTFSSSKNMRKKRTFSSSKNMRKKRTFSSSKNMRKKEHFFYIFLLSCIQYFLNTLLHNKNTVMCDGVMICVMICVSEYFSMCVFFIVNEHRLL
jgi:hypothetical protein